VGSETIVTFGVGLSRPEVLRALKACALAGVLLGLAGDGARRRGYHVHMAHCEQDARGARAARRAQRPRRRRQRAYESKYTINPCVVLCFPMGSGQRDYAWDQPHRRAGLAGDARGLRPMAPRELWVEARDSDQWQRHRLRPGTRSQALQCANPLTLHRWVTRMRPSCPCSHSSGTPCGARSPAPPRVTPSHSCRRSQSRAGQSWGMGSRGAVKRCGGNSIRILPDTAVVAVILTFFWIKSISDRTKVEWDTMELSRKNRARNSGQQDVT
jgi:hypothetical protein